MTSAMTRTSRLQSVVELTIPARADLIVMARLAVATVANRLGFDIGEVDDLRLAVDELCLLVAPGDVDGRLRLSFGGDHGLIEVVCVFEPEMTTGNEDGDATVDAGGDHHDEALSGLIVGALVDEYEVSSGDGGVAEGWLRKHKMSS